MIPNISIHPQNPLKRPKHKIKAALFMNTIQETNYISLSHYRRILPHSKQYHPIVRSNLRFNNGALMVSPGTIKRNPLHPPKRKKILIAYYYHMTP